MANTPNIKRSKNNKEKYNMYTELLDRYKNALEYQYYFEALVIDYAMIENRLSSILASCGVMLDTYTKNIGNDNNREILYDLLKIDKNKNYQIDSISKKRTSIESLIKFASKENSGNSEYLINLKKGLNELDLTNLRRLLKKIQKWTPKRDEIIHAVFNKNDKDLSDKIHDIVTDGMELAREVDKYAKKIRRKKDTRKSAGMTAG